MRKPTKKYVGTMETSQSQMREYRKRYLCGTYPKYAKDDESSHESKSDEDKILNTIIIIYFYKIFL